MKSVDIREELSKNYDFFETYSTVQGYSEDYMNQLVSALEQNQIHASFLFVESGPVGMMSYTHRAGTFELYVQKDKVQEAADVIHQFMNK